MCVYVCVCVCVYLCKSESSETKARLEKASLAAKQADGKAETYKKEAEDAELQKAGFVDKVGASLCVRMCVCVSSCEAASNACGVCVGCL